MSYKIIRQKIIDVAKEELELANKEFDPFNSWHEAAAVLYEEYQEAADELKNLMDLVLLFWAEVKREETTPATIKTLRRHAINLACEAAQVAAMATKTMQYGKMEEDEADSEKPARKEKKTRSLRKWNYTTERYEPYEVPEEWTVTTYEADLKTKVNCASCGAIIEYGKGYTSADIYAEEHMDFYTVCEDCFAQEQKRRAEAEKL